MPKDLSLSSNLGLDPGASQGKAEDQEFLKKRQPKLDERFISL